MTVSNYTLIPITNTSSTCSKLPCQVLNFSDKIYLIKLISEEKKEETPAATEEKKEGEAK